LINLASLLELCLDLVTFKSLDHLKNTLRLVLLAIYKIWIPNSENCVHFITRLLALLRFGVLAISQIIIKILLVGMPTMNFSFNLVVYLLLAIVGFLYSGKFEIFHIE